VQAFPLPGALRARLPRATDDGGVRLDEAEHPCSDPRRCFNRREVDIARLRGGQGLQRVADLQQPVRGGDPCCRERQVMDVHA
jgi:hypothetical protein